jgi:predicted NAD/FAD-dependent oxidoreductase
MADANLRIHQSSGLSAAKHILKNALKSGRLVKVTVLDKGRSVGGRCATRHVNGSKESFWNTGAQVICFGTGSQSFFCNRSDFTELHSPRSALFGVYRFT